MKKFIRGLASSISIGITIGLVVSTFFSYLYKTKYLLPSSPSFVKNFETPLDAFIVSIIIWGLMGVVFFLSQYIFLLEKLSITQQTIYHFIVTYCGYTILAVCAGWFPDTFSWLIFYTGIFVLIYCLIWFFSMKEAKKITAALNKLGRL